MKPQRPSRAGPAVRRLSSYRKTAAPPHGGVRIRSRGLAPAGRNAREPNTTTARTAGDLLRLVLPVPPSINHHYATVNGRRVLSAAGRRFKSLVGQEVLCALSKQARRHGPLALPSPTLFALDLRFYFVSQLRRDIDGGLKITQDALCEALGINDNRIVEVTLRKDRDPVAPRMELALRSLTPSANPAIVREPAEKDTLTHHGSHVGP